MRLPRWLKLTVAMASLAGTATAGSSASSPLSAALTAGTGRADITPTALLPFNNGTGDPTFTGVHDPLFARALALEQKGVRTVLVVADVINLPYAMCDRIVARIAARFAVAPDHVLLVATHVHTVPWSFDHGYERQVSDGVVAAVAAALGSPEPVTLGTGEGRAFLNINRDEATARGFILGQDPSGPSDKAVRVVGLFRADGTPKAILANYAVHAVVLHSSATGPDRTALVSADLPGAANADVDARFPGAMTFWTSGAAADQNPVMMSIYAEPGAQGRPALTDLGPAGFEVVRRWGQDLGLEIARVVAAMRPRPVVTPITVKRLTVTCPAKAGGAAVPIRLASLRIGSVDLLSVSGEVATRIDQHLRAQAGHAGLLTVTLAGGYAGYLPDEASYARGATFEVEHSRVAPGCAEAAIVNGAVTLLAR